jgi:UDP-glucose 4-epimerase
VVRPFNTYGPREHAEGTSAEVIPKFVHRALAGRSPVILGEGLQTRDFTWVEDTARGILAAAASDDLVGEAVNIAKGQEVTIAEVCRLVLERVGRPGLEVEYRKARPGDVDRHYADTGRARRLLGFVPEVDIVEGIGRYVDWLEGEAPDLDAWIARDKVQNW